jgi:hypothetical protein
MNKIIKILLVLCLAILLGASACYRERPSENPPIHLNPNMDSQPKSKAQSESGFFENGMSMRLPVEGTVSQGNLRDDIAYYTGKDSRGNFIRVSPVIVDESILLKGQERYEIYCSPCHSRIGDGRGIVVEKGMVPPPSFHIDRIRNMPDGEIYDIISNGIRNMPSYKHQIPVHDRWAIVHYFRALQMSQNVDLLEIPVELRGSLK